MNIKAKLISNRGGVLVFETDYPPDVEVDKFYNLTLKQYKNSRSLEQNALMWELITQIANCTAGADKWDIYISGLEKANAEYEYLACLPETEESLKRVFRAIKPAGLMPTPKGKQMTVYKCYTGSSKYTSKEMTELIDYFSLWLESIKKGAENG